MLSSRFSQCNLPWNTLWTCKHLLYFEKSKISFKLSIFIACRKLSYNSCLLFRCFHKFLLKNFKTLQSSGLTFVSHSVSSYGILPELAIISKEMFAILHIKWKLLQVFVLFCHKSQCATSHVCIWTFVTFFYLPFLPVQTD